jgi:hypothetical protein
MNTAHVAAKPIRGIVILTGYAATVVGVWGYDMVACRGVGAGTLSAMMRLAFLVFVSPGVFASVVALLAGCSAAALALGALPLFRQCRELLLFVLPVAAFLVGIWLATSGAVHVRCSLAPWR